ncbi:hypothetical protein [Asticcacaulis sp. AC402]|uniref:hypothetical protein n=1 Tax=Asticcacaulis sp. AC402 TaxID=1282361 RepID=UPI0003C3B27A|nr:hypothetical protein [Asticcacaulis sp. AC402]ESQ76106.1 hypothetical protein ABAC402_06565 [Asticcacaulis sp. AC402]
MRRFLTLTACFAALVAGPAIAQTDASDPNYHELLLNIGESGRMVQTAKITRNSTRKDLTETRITEEVATLDYALQDDGGYAITRKVTQFKSSDGDRLPQTMSERSSAALAKAASDMTVSFTTDENLRPVRIENWPAFKDFVYEVFASAAVIPEEKASMRAFADSVFGQMTDESAAPLFLANEAYLAVPRNTALVLNEPISWDSQISIPIGNATLDAREVIVLTEWREATNTARLTYDYAPTSDSMRAFLAGFLPRFIQLLNLTDTARTEIEQQLAAGMESSLVDISTHCDYSMAIDTGIVKEATCVKTVAFAFGPESRKKVDLYEFSEILAQ